MAWRIEQKIAWILIWQEKGILTVDGIWRVIKYIHSMCITFQARSTLRQIKWMCLMQCPKNLPVQPKKCIIFSSSFLFLGLALQNIFLRPRCLCPKEVLMWILTIRICLLLLLIGYSFLVFLLGSATFNSTSEHGQSLCWILSIQLKARIVLSGSLPSFQVGLQESLSRVHATQYFH